MQTFVLTANVDDFELRYFETVRKSEDDDANIYGICVEKYIEGNLVEKMDSGPFSSDAGQISEIMTKLANNSVTPFALCETLDEMEI